MRYADSPRPRIEAGSSGWRRAEFSSVTSRPTERGSVFIVALMVLVMLTVIGLSLALVTETEMLIGGNEQIINETHFAAETGQSVAVSQLLVANSMDSKCMAQLVRNPDDTARQLGVLNLGYSVDFTTLYPVSFNVAPLTKANEGREDQLFAGFFRAETRALRGSWLVVEDSDLDTDAFIPPREEGQALEDTDFTVQAQRTLDLALFSAPLQALEAGTLVAAFDHPENFGCDPHPDHSEISAPPP